jgi:hypothetical protein
VGQHSGGAGKADLQAIRLKIGLIEGMERAGIEPATFGLQSRRSPS